MKTIFLLIVIFCFNFKLKAQIEVSKNGDSYVINMLNANFGSTTNFSKTNPGHTVWYEFGDGKFTTKSSFKHVLNSSANIGNALLKINGIYENGTKPTKILSNFNTTTSVNLSNNYIDEANDALTQGYNIKITSNVNDVKFNDTMHFAIDYRVPDENGKNPWKLVFEYNISGANDVYAKSSDFFYQTFKSQFLFDAYENNIKVPFIRTHFGEQVNDNIYNKIEFTNLSKVAFAKTVFVTLITKHNEQEDGFTGGVKAYFIREGDTKISGNNMDQSSMKNMGDKPHDPNYIIVDKKCIRPNTKDTILKYHLHFQNTGTGKADDMLHIAVKLPKHILPTQINPINGNLKVVCSENNLETFISYSHHAIKAPTPEETLAKTSGFSKNIVYYDNTTDEDSIHFLIKTAVGNYDYLLFGMDTTKPNAMANKKTMGDIYFEIRLPSYPIFTNLNARAAIVFDTEHSVLTEKETTKVRPWCKRRKQADCNCDKKKKRTFYEWLMEKCE